MTAEERSFDWRLPAVWAVLLAISMVAQTYVYMADEARRGIAMGFDRALAIQGTSHLVIAALLPALYWLQRRWPASGGLGNLLILGLAVVPFSLAHTAGMGALRLLWFSAIMGEPYRFPLTFDRLAYEFAKDVVSYGMLSVGVVVLGRLFRRAPAPAAAPAKPVPAEPPAGGVDSGTLRGAKTRRPRSHGRGRRHRLGRGGRQLRRSSMSAATRSRSAPRSASSKASSIPSASCGSTNPTW